MTWLESVLKAFRKDPQMVRFITDKFKELHDITAEENKELKQRVAELEMTVAKNKQDIEQIEMHESDCHRMLIEERKKFIELREWIIFETKKKPPL